MTDIGVHYGKHGYGRGVVSETIDTIGDYGETMVVLKHDGTNSVEVQ